MSNEQKIELLEDMMEVDAGSLAGDMLLEDIDEYDSFFKLYLVTYAKKEMGQKLTVEEIAQFKTVQDICDYLK